MLPAGEVAGKRPVLLRIGSHTQPFPGSHSRKLLKTEMTQEPAVEEVEESRALKVGVVIGTCLPSCYFVFHCHLHAVFS